MQVETGKSHLIAQSIDKKVFSWGSNSHGQLGIGQKAHSNYKSLQHLLFFDEKLLVSFSCGQTHSIGTTIDGLVYSWGNNEKGQLGINSQFKKFPKADLPTLVESLIGTSVTQCRARGDRSYFMFATVTENQSGAIFKKWKEGLIKFEQEYRSKIEKA